MSAGFGESRVKGTKSVLFTCKLVILLELKEYLREGWLEREKERERVR